MFLLLIYFLFNNIIKQIDKNYFLKVRLEKNAIK
jgi:hypothetical protein